MKTRFTLSILSIAFSICLSALFIINSHAETDDDVDIWQTWIDQQTDNILDTTQDVNDDELNERRSTISNIFTLLADELKKHMSSPPQIKKENLSEDIQKKIIKITTDEILTPEFLEKHLQDSGEPKIIVSDGFAVSNTYPHIHVETHKPTISYRIQKNTVVTDGIEKKIQKLFSNSKSSEKPESIDALKKKIDKLSKQVERLNRKLSRIQSELKSE